MKSVNRIPGACRVRVLVGNGRGVKAGVATLALLVSAGFATRSRAQLPPPATPPVAAPADPATPDAAGASGVDLSYAIGKIAKIANVQIIMDTVSANTLVNPSRKVTTTANFESQIDALVAQLPAGATWAKLYLPDSGGKTYSGDDLAEYAVAESKVFGAVGGALPPGTIEVLGQKLSPDKAAAVITALNLKPVYLILNPSPAKTAGGMTQQQWAALTSEQKQQFAQGQAQLLLSLDPAQRTQALMQMFGQATAVATAMMSGLPPEEQKQFVQSIMGAIGAGGARPGGTPPPPPQ